LMSPQYWEAVAAGGGAAGFGEEQPAVTTPATSSPTRVHVAKGMRMVTSNDKRPPQSANLKSF
jgi:hypothetical protein